VVLVAPVDTLAKVTPVIKVIAARAVTVPVIKFFICVFPFCPTPSCTYTAWG
jgi:hypothetical protein